jgi:lipoprotein-anchoring transpeptidase ErfK/SrfK
MSIRFRAAVLAATLGLCTLAPPAVEAAQLTSIKVSETARLPAVRPDWPIPREANQVFYLQRSSNSNTVVYTALFDAAGNLDPNRPGQVYWRRYNTDGTRKALKSIERRFAYGFDTRKTDTPGEFIMTLKALPEIPMLLRQEGPGKAALYGRIGGKTVRVVYAYVTLDESGLIPKVTELSIHGIDPGSGRAISETFRVAGGVIRQ